MPPTVGAHVGGTWNSSPRSQLQEGYMNANSAAKERTPRSHVHKHKDVCAPAPWLVFRIHQPFPASAPKSVISETEKWNEARFFSERLDWCPQNGTNTEIKLFAKAASFDGWHLRDGIDQCVRQATPNPCTPTTARGGKSSLSFKVEEHRAISKSIQTLPSPDGFLHTSDAWKRYSNSFFYSFFLTIHPSG